MSKVSGIVERKFQNLTKAGITYGIVVNNTKYGFFTSEPACKEGDNVEFMAKQNGNFWNADAKTLRLLASAPAAPVNPATTASPSRTWVPDKDRQDSITFQSARKDALEFMNLLAAKDLIDVGKAKNKAAIIDVYEVFLDKYTQRFFEDTKNLGHKVEAPVVEEESDPNDDLPY